MTVLEKNKLDITKISSVIMALQNPKFKTYVDQWNFLLNSYIGGIDYTTQDYLIKAQYETDTEFANFKKNVFYPNYNKLIINKYARNIYRNPPQREGYEELEKAFYYYLVGGKQTEDINSFYKNLFVYLSILGDIYTIIDHPIVDESLPISDLQRQQGLRYTEEILLPQSVLVYIPDELAIIQIDQHYMKAWTNEEWIVYKDREVKERDINQFGRLPITRHSFDVNADGFGEALTRDIAPINKIMYNLINRYWLNCINESYQSIYIPLDEKTVPLWGLLGKKQSDGRTTLDNLGRVNFIAAGSNIQNLAKDSTLFNVSMDYCKYLEETINKLSSQRNEIVLATSGISKAYDAENYATSIEMYAEIMETIEKQETQLKYNILKNTEPPDTLVIKYNRKYGIYDESKTITDLKMIADDSGMPQKARDIAKFEIIKRILTLSTQDEIDIENEIFTKPEPSEMQTGVETTETTAPDEELIIKNNLQQAKEA